MRIIVLLICLLFSQCNPSQKNKIERKKGYDLTQPSDRFVLPKKLNEISGLTRLDDNRLLAVQDEKANIYTLDAYSGEIIDSYDFGSNSDFEGIAIKGENIYVLKSSGTIIRIKNKKKKESYNLKNSKKLEFEGLCYDQKNDRLLLVCKENTHKKHKDEIQVYAFSIEEEKFEKDPVYNLDKHDIHTNFKPSGIAIHPETGLIYILSSASQTLLVINEAGEVMSKTQLSPRLYQQAEGICFNHKNELFISNEKKDREPTLMRFELKK